MTLETNAIVTGKVTGIRDFGAFVALPDGRSGLVHISEVAQGYVEDIRQHLQEGQEVRVIILPPDANGRLNLSVKRVPPEQTFEDKLKDFMDNADVIAEVVEVPRQERRKKCNTKWDDEDDFDFEDY